MDRFVVVNSFYMSFTGIWEIRRLFIYSSGNSKVIVAFGGNTDVYFDRNRELYVGYLC